MSDDDEPTFLDCGMVVTAKDYSGVHTGEPSARLVLVVPDDFAEAYAATFR